MHVNDRKKNWCAHFSFYLKLLEVALIDDDLENYSIESLLEL